MGSTSGREALGPRTTARFNEFWIWTPGHDLLRTVLCCAVKQDRHRPTCRHAGSCTHEGQSHAHHRGARLLACQSTATSGWILASKRASSKSALDLGRHVVADPLPRPGCPSKRWEVSELSPHRTVRKNFRTSSKSLGSAKAPKWPPLGIRAVWPLLRLSARGERRELHERSADSDYVRAVDAEGQDRRSAGGRATDNAAVARHTKMIRPELLARMEQRHQLRRGRWREIGSSGG